MWCVCTGLAASCPSPCLATASSQVSPAGVLLVTLGIRIIPGGLIGLLPYVTKLSHLANSGLNLSLIPRLLLLCNPIKAVPAFLNRADHPSLQFCRGQRQAQLHFLF